MGNPSLVTLPEMKSHLHVAILSDQAIIFYQPHVRCPDLRRALFLQTRIGSKQSERDPFKAFLRSRKIDVKSGEITEERWQYDADSLSAHLVELVREEACVLWNLTGGTKVHHRALWQAFMARRERHSQDVAVYLDAGSQRTVWHCSVDSPSSAPRIESTYAPVPVEDYVQCFGLQVESCTHSSQDAPESLDSEWTRFRDDPLHRRDLLGRFEHGAAGRAHSDSKTLKEWRDLMGDPAADRRTPYSRFREAAHDRFMKSTLANRLKDCRQPPRPLDQKEARTLLQLGENAVNGALEAAFDLSLWSQHLFPEAAVHEDPFSKVFERLVQTHVTARARMHGFDADRLIRHNVLVESPSRKGVPLIEYDTAISLPSGRLVALEVKSDPATAGSKDIQSRLNAHRGAAGVRAEFWIVIPWCPEDLGSGAMRKELRWFPFKLQAAGHRFVCVPGREAPFWLARHGDEVEVLPEQPSDGTESVKCESLDSLLDRLLATPKQGDQ